MLNYLTRRAAPTPFINLTITSHGMKLYDGKSVWHSFGESKPDIIALVGHDQPRLAGEGPLMPSLRGEYRPKATIGQGPDSAGQLTIELYVPKD